jgi:hypothetical protein
MMVTSTPNEYIRELADKHKIPLLIREGKSDICDDWNFACESAMTDWVTVAHQDDYYDKHYVEEFLTRVKKNEDASLFITDYRPIKHGKISSDVNCYLRKFLKWPLRIPALRKSRFMRKWMLAFGNSICCPTVAYNKKVTGTPIFTSSLKYDIDWDTFLKFAKGKAKFIYAPKYLVYYRIHNESTSAEYIENKKRIQDDIYMFNQFWPSWMTGIIMIFYKKAYKTYEN